MLKRGLSGCLLGAMLAGTAAAGCDKPAGEAALADGLLQWINQERAAHGARPYARSAKLDRAAEFTPATWLCAAISTIRGGQAGAGSRQLAMAEGRE